MNIEQNLKIIRNYGDQIQHEFGAEFGNYAHKIDYNHYSRLCKYLNNQTWMVNNGYSFNPVLDRNGRLLILASNYSLDLKFAVKCLDFSLFFDVTDTDWQKIKPQLYKKILDAWHSMLSSMIPEYRERLNKITVLSNHFARQEEMLSLT